MKCLGCGKEMPPYADKFKKKQRKFCNSSCQIKYRRGNRMGDWGFRPYKYQSTKLSEVTNETTE